MSGETPAKSIASSAMPSGTNRTPNGCVIGFAKEVEDAIGACRFGGKKTQFLLKVHSASFGNAGWQKGEDAGLRSFFDLHEMCTLLDANKANVARIRRQLEEDHILTYSPNHDDYATGWLVWNRNLAEWAPLKPGATHRGGNHRKQPSVIHLVKEAGVISLEQEDAPSGLHSPAFTPENDVTKWITPARHESIAALVAMDEPKNKVTEEIDYEESVANATQQKLWLSNPRIPIAPLKKKLEQVARYKKTTATKEQIAALWDAWEKQSGTAQRKNMSDKELKRFYAVMARLVDKGVTPEELASLAAALLRTSAWKSNYTARPSEVEDNLSTLRPIARGEVQPSTPTNRTQKGKTYERHDGTWTGNHGKDAAIVTKC